MTVGEFAASVIGQLGYVPNLQQRLVVDALARFCSPAASVRADAVTASRDRVFIVNGYAGTGKTSLCGALVRALHAANIETVLMAPTGRAAKVFGAFAGYPAYTIHRRIYRHALGPGQPPLQENRSKDGTVFIVDEASMISDVSTDAGPSGDGSLLRDLLQYVFAGNGHKLILIGDTAQLPPVGSDFSPAMDAGVLKSLGMTVSRATLTAIARQGAMSGILANATAIRRSMQTAPIDALPEIPAMLTEADGYADVRTLSPEDLPEVIDGCYRGDGGGIDETIVVTRSNRRAADFNRAIRAQVLYLEEELERGELMLVAKNNYHWSRGVNGLDFIANGDRVTVDRVYGTEARYGMRFADVALTMTDRPDISFDAKIMLETLANDAPALTSDRYDRLYQGIMAANCLTPGTPEAGKALRNDPYWNALQVKYAYAVTCHKAQGGQWANVLVDMGGLAPDAAANPEFSRWLYTAVTRARNRLWLIGDRDAD